MLNRRIGVTIIGAIGLALLLASCAAGDNTSANTPASDGDIAGFWMGFWHGYIAVITFVISLFNENVNIYEVHNNGGWYDFGFLWGAGAFALCSGGVIKRSRS